MSFEDSEETTQRFPLKSPEAPSKKSSVEESDEDLSEKEKFLQRLEGDTYEEKEADISKEKMERADTEPSFKEYQEQEEEMEQEEETERKTLRKEITSQPSEKKPETSGIAFEDTVLASPESLPQPPKKSLKTKMAEGFKKMANWFKKEEPKKEMTSAEMREFDDLSKFISDVTQQKIAPSKLEDIISSDKKPIEKANDLLKLFNIEKLENQSAKSRIYNKIRSMILTPEIRKQEQEEVLEAYNEADLGMLDEKSKEFKKRQAELQKKISLITEKYEGELAEIVKKLGITDLQ